MSGILLFSLPLPKRVPDKTRFYIDIIIASVLTKHGHPGKAKRINFGLGYGCTHPNVHILLGIVLQFPVL